MELIIIVHLLGDFYLQTDTMADKKRKSIGLMGQYGAIGFVLTAKSLARYKQLENKAFAEKYLVGTLLGSFIAIVSVAVCSVLI